MQIFITIIFSIIYIYRVFLFKPGTPLKYKQINLG